MLCIVGKSCTAYSLQPSHESGRELWVNLRWKQSLWCHLGRSSARGRWRTRQSWRGPRCRPQPTPTPRRTPHMCTFKIKDLEPFSNFWHFLTCRSSWHRRRPWSGRHALLRPWSSGEQLHPVISIRLFLDQKVLEQSQEGLSNTLLPAFQCSIWRASQHRSPVGLLPLWGSSWQQGSPGQNIYSTPINYPDIPDIVIWDTLMSHS